MPPNQNNESGVVDSPTSPNPNNSSILDIADDIEGNADDNPTNTSSSNAQIIQEQPLSPTDIANAEHLDQLESSGAIDDIASFQDIELPPSPGVVDNGDLESNTGATGDHPQDTIRRAKTFYYYLPMIQRYKFPLAGCMLVFVALMVAIGLTAKSSVNSKNALTAANSNSKNNGDNGGEYEGMVVNDAPPPQYAPGEGFDSDVGVPGGDITNDPFARPYEYEDIMQEVGSIEENEFGDEEVGDLPSLDGVEEGGDELGDAFEHDTAEDQDNQMERPGDDEDDTPWPSSSAQVTTPKPTSKPTQKPTPNQASNSASNGKSPSHSAPANQPKWFQTTNSNYVTLLNEHDEAYHSHLIAGLFCANQNLQLCSYEDYCPSGIKNSPFQGGPPRTVPNQSAANDWNTLEQVQWAPYKPANPTAANSAAGGAWVQVGTVAAEDGGTVGNGNGQCWEWAAWNKNGDVNDIEIEWNEDHRRWILCCETENDNTEYGGWDED